MIASRGRKSHLVSRQPTDIAKKVSMVLSGIVTASTSSADLFSRAFVRVLQSQAWDLSRSDVDQDGLSILVQTDSKAERLKSSARQHEGNFEIELSAELGH